MTDHGPGSGPAGRRLLAALDRLDAPVRAVQNQGGYFQLEGRGHQYVWGTIARLVDAGLIAAEGDGGDVVWLRFTAAGRALLGA